tara:strand:- start:74 stop:2881 length:2808 start_codon:yes stop_codon:yes gene_type:complete
MSVKKFKFVSPGVFINEIDNSQLPSEPAAEGPTIIGRSLRGPALRPVQVDSFEEFVDVFGPPIAGTENVDAFRNPAFGCATYGTYAAQAWLRNSSTINFVRLIGKEHPNKSSGGEAGWKLADFSNTGGGAYGLFVFNSASAGNHTGTLGAIIYCDADTHVQTSGTVPNAVAVTGSGQLMQTTNNEITLRIVRGGGTLETAVNFDRTSRKYIRSVLNTNPTRTTTAITPTANQEEYFLGETFDRAITEDLGGAGNIAFAMAVPLDNGTVDGADFQRTFVNAETGDVISQDLLASSDGFDAGKNDRATKLFKFVGLQTGEYDQGAIKISIENIRPAKRPGQFGTFNVIIRRMDDNDAKLREVERFNNLNLNPASTNYIAAQIGDQNVEWDENERVYKTYGQYPNNSSYVRMSMAQAVDDGTIDSSLLPYGFFGPSKFKNVTLASGSALVAANDFLSATGTLPNAAKPNVTFFPLASSGDLVLGNEVGPVVFKFPSIPLRSTTAVGDVSSPQAAFFGLTATRGTGSTIFDDSIPDFLRTKPASLNNFSSLNALTEFSHIFTLDDLVESDGNMTYSSGSRQGGTSLTAVSGAYSILTGGLAPKGFTMPMFGGYDAMDITEKDPFANRNMDGESERSSYAYHAMTVAIDSVKDPEVVQTNILSIPGVTTTTVTDKLLDLAQDRGDCLAVIDLKGGYQPTSETSDGFSSRVGSVTATVNNLNNRAINTSFGCAFYPWVRVQDSFSDSTVWLPPSVVAIGAFSFTDRNAEPWFAPAGFTRGGLTKGAGGLRVLGVADRLRSKDRDDLYEANINPIGTFPNEGVVILGQKTLQTDASALDRINVRRLLIFTKRQITAVANDLLFEQNVPDTWNNFLSKAEPILRDIKAGFGLEDYKLVLDETTTTPELRDRNVLYAKVFLKPAKSIEFIALDFVITNSAATFE